MDRKFGIPPVYQMQDMNIDVKCQERNRFNWAKGRGWEMMNDKHYKEPLYCSICSEFELPS